VSAREGVTKPLEVTAVGMVSSVGHGAHAACAAIRAGITRPQSLAGSTQLNLDTMTEEATLGCPVRWIAEGFVNAGKWLQLAPVALADLCTTACLPKADDVPFWSRTALLLVTPLLDEARFFPDEICLAGELEKRFAVPLLRAVAAEAAPCDVVLLPRGRCGVHEAAALAQEHIAATRWDRAIVLAVDSLIDAPALELLGTLGQLASEENPVGIRPGEGAACLLLETQSAASRRGATPIARLGSSVTAEEANAFLRGEQSLGEALATAIDECLQPLAPGFGGDVISDHNGEPWRASEYGHLQLRARSVNWSRARVSFPCASVGDVGAAAGAFGLVLAARALQRGYASRDGVLVLNSDDHGPVGCSFLTGVTS
jgi:3-oxoacyl-[acyl-carrier-protein] synthase I